MQKLMINGQKQRAVGRTEISGRLRIIDDANTLAQLLANWAFFGLSANIRRSSRIRIWLSFWGKHRELLNLRRKLPLPGACTQDSKYRPDNTSARWFINQRKMICVRASSLLRRP